MKDEHRTNSQSKPTSSKRCTVCLAETRASYCLNFWECRFNIVAIRAFDINVIAICDFMMPVAYVQ